MPPLAEATRLAEALDLLPIAGPPAATLESLAARLSGRVQLPCHVLPERTLPLPRVAGRNQLDAGELLKALEARPRPDRRLLVGVTTEDIAIPIFTFVFGLARQGGDTCIVSSARADPCFYGLPADETLRDERTVAEALHELGHLAALDHCPDRGCLMSFAGSVEKADARGSRFCSACARKMPAWLAGRSHPPAGP